MSHWLDLPSLVRVRDGKRLWSAEFPWSLSQHHWQSSLELELEMRKYPGDRTSQRVQIQLDTQTFRGWQDSLHNWSTSSHPLRELNDYLEEGLAP